MTRFTFTTSIERDIEVAYDISPFVEATRLQPAEGGEIEILSVKMNGVEIALTDEEEAALIAECEERGASDLGDAEADRDDYLYEQQRDRQMMADWENEA